MSLDQKQFTAELTRRLMLLNGWSEDLATATAAIARDVILDTHGGGRHYIPARRTDNRLIRSEYNAGIGIATLARRHNLTVQRIRRIISN